MATRLTRLPRQDNLAKPVDIFEKKNSSGSQIYSIFRNALHNAAPLVMYGLGKTCESLCGDTCSENPYFMWIPVGISAISGYFLIKNYLYKDSQKAIDTIIRKFDRLATLSSEGRLEPGAPNTLTFEELLRKTASSYTAHDYLALIEFTLYAKSRELFDWHSITGSNAEPFNNLSELLREIITSDDEEDTQISENLRATSEEVLSKLTELKGSRSGLYNEFNEHKYPDCHPRIIDLTNTLVSLEKKLLLSDEAIDAETKEAIDICLLKIASAKKVDSIFKNHKKNSNSYTKLTKTDLNFLEEALIGLKENLGTPASYKKHKESFERTALSPVLRKLKHYFPNPNSSHKDLLDEVSSVKKRALFVQVAEIKQTPIPKKENILQEAYEVVSSDPISEELVLQKIKTFDAIYDLTLKICFDEKRAENQDAAIKEIFENAIRALALKEGLTLDSSATIETLIESLTNEN